MFNYYLLPTTRRCTGRDGMHNAFIMINYNIYLTFVGTEKWDKMKGTQ